MTTYDNIFFDYVNSGAINSANEILPYILKDISVKSVLDVGCGQGAWLSVWEKLSVTDITGLDGSYVDRENLLVDEENFISHDLSNKFVLNRQFDIVQSLEVAEHLPENSAGGFIESLVRHGNFIIFSSAPKGQGGDNHVNEQDYNYWRELFSNYGYEPIDYLRPLLAGNENIEPWYRYNVFFYVSRECLKNLPEKYQACIVKERDELRDVSPFTYQVRKKIVQFMPVWMMSLAAKIKEKYVVWKRSK